MTETNGPHSAGDSSTSLGGNNAQRPRWMSAKCRKPSRADQAAYYKPSMRFALLSVRCAPHLISATDAGTPSWSRLADFSCSCAPADGGVDDITAIHFSSRARCALKQNPRLRLSKFLRLENRDVAEGTDRWRRVSDAPPRRSRTSAGAIYAAGTMVRPLTPRALTVGGRVFAQVAGERSRVLGRDELKSRLSLHLHSVGLVQSPRHPAMDFARKCR